MNGFNLQGSHKYISDGDYDVFWNFLIMWIAFMTTDFCIAFCSVSESSIAIRFSVKDLGVTPLSDYYNFVNFSLLP